MLFWRLSHPTCLSGQGREAPFAFHLAFMSTPIRLQLGLAWPFRGRSKAKKTGWLEELRDAHITQFIHQIKETATYRCIDTSTVLKVIEYSL